MSYSASVVAWAFVKKGIEEGNPITQMKLQKMLFFAQGIHLVLNKKQSLLKEQFQAWKYGPVIPVIYQEYKFYGSDPITETFYISFGNDEQYDNEVSTLDTAAQNTIALTWKNTSSVDAIRLSNWTHRPDSPWTKYYKPGTNDITIPNEDIFDFFQKFITPNEPAQK